MNIPLRLVATIIIGLLIGDYLPANIVSIFYTISMIIKDTLMVFLPLIVFSYLFAAILSFERRAPVLIAVTLLTIIISNAFAVMTAYGVSAAVFPFLIQTGVQKLQSIQSDVSVLWSIPFSAPLSADKSLILSIIAGFIGIFVGGSKLKNLAFSLRDFSTKVLRSSFIPVLPLYVFGFVLKLDRDGTFGILASQYGAVFAISCTLLVVYIAFMYFAACKFNIGQTIQAIREMLPAGLTGFSTMSSTATMPVTLDATEKNLKDPEFADFIIPTTVNNHLVGDGINIALTAIALLLMTNQPFPPLSLYIVFAMHYCIVKFSAAGVPGGGVIVILPVAQKYLGLTPEATSLLATIYILQDPILSACNVMGNGAFAILVKRVMEFFKLSCSTPAKENACIIKNEKNISIACEK